MAKLVYSQEELMADHPYAKRQEDAGYLMHGGFDEAGTYISPRTLHRWPAVKAWQGALKEKGVPLIDASVELLKHGNFPNVEQQKFLLKNGYGQSLWNSLTVTGIVEARGRALCEFTAPDFQDIIVDDISETATGHLGKGLLYAHGADEGGDPDQPQYGAHDAMWFAARDLLFGANAYPDDIEPDNISRPDQGRLMPQLPEVYEQIILLLMNVLMIEVRAEAFFSFCQKVMRDPDVFQDRREAAERAAVMVERIRTDEAIHVGYLQTVVSEMRAFTFKTVDGGTIAGKDLIDPIWQGMIHWHAETQHEKARELSYERVREHFEAMPEGAKLLDQFNALGARAKAA